MKNTLSTDKPSLSSNLSVGKRYSTDKPQFPLHLSSEKRFLADKPSRLLPSGGGCGLRNWGQTNKAGKNANLICLCPKPGSNRHVFKGHWILSPTRLPIPPFGPFAAGTHPTIVCKGIQKSSIIKFFHYLRLFAGGREKRMAARTIDGGGAAGGGERGEGERREWQRSRWPEAVPAAERREGREREENGSPDDGRRRCRRRKINRTSAELKYDLYKHTA